MQSLSADSIRELVESLGPKFADIGEQLQENGYDGAILADASDEDLDELFGELEVPKLKQKVLRKKLTWLKEGISTASLDERPAEGPPAAAAPEDDDYVVDAYDCFLSHKRSDCQDVVARVHDRLTDAGYRAFIDREELEELPKLKASVRASGKLVFFMSPKIFESDWCMLELARRSTAALTYYRSPSRARRGAAARGCFPTSSSTYRSASRSRARCTIRARQRRRLLRTQSASNTRAVTSTHSLTSSRNASAPPSERRRTGRPRAASRGDLAASGAIVGRRAQDASRDLGRGGRRRRIAPGARTRPRPRRRRR